MSWENDVRARIELIRLRLKNAREGVDLLQKHNSIPKYDDHQIGCFCAMCNYHAGERIVPFFNHAAKPEGDTDFLINAVLKLLDERVG